MTRSLNRMTAIEKAVWCLPLFVFLISCASTPKEEPLSWKVTFFSLGAKVQFSAEAPVQRLSAFNMDGVVVCTTRFPRAALGRRSHSIFSGMRGRHLQIRGDFVHRKC